MAHLKGIWATSGTAMEGPGEFRGFITLQAEAHDGTVLEGRLGIDETRSMALNFLAVAEAAESGAAIFTLLTSEGDFEPEQAAAFVRRLRDHRQDQREQASEEPE